MKSLRMSVLVLVLGIVSGCSTLAYGQQEVDPDHFDQTSAVKTHVLNPKAHGLKRASSGTNAKLASARVRKARRHQHA